MERVAVGFQTAVMARQSFHRVVLRCEQSKPRGTGGMRSHLSRRRASRAVPQNDGSEFLEVEAGMPAPSFFTLSPLAEGGSGWGHFRCSFPHPALLRIADLPRKRER
jgi:hypothetical protein